MSKIIDSLKNKSSSGFDEISSKVLKRLKIQLAITLTAVFNLILRSGIVPIKLKTAVICPIYKSGQDDIYTNYRPISLLTSISKVLEKIVYNQLTEFISKNNILYNRQFGFRKGFQTTHALMNLLQTLSKNKTVEKHTLAIFLDVK